MNKPSDKQNTNNVNTWKVRDSSINYKDIETQFELIKGQMDQSEYLKKYYNNYHDRQYDYYDYAKRKSSPEQANTRPKPTQQAVSSSKIEPSKDVGRALADLINELR